MSYTVTEIIATILKEVPGAPFADTVDTLKAGSGEMTVTGIVTTFIPTLDVLRRAVDAGANLIITHEPTYFNHRDEVDWLANDPLYAVKHQFILDHHLAIWRFHDHWHAHQPDGVVTGLLNLLGWEAAPVPGVENQYQLPATTLGGLADFFQSRLGLPHVRMVGAPEMRVERVALWVGSYDGETQIRALGEQGADVLVVGETSEWQLYEYVRDANAAGLPKGLIVLGHERSEEPGMAYLALWLQERFPGLPIQHIPAGDPLFIK